MINDNDNNNDNDNDDNYYSNNFYILAENEGKIKACEEAINIISEKISEYYDYETIIYYNDIKINKICSISKI